MQAGVDKAASWLIENVKTHLANVGIAGVALANVGAAGVALAHVAGASVAVALVVVTCMGLKGL